MKESGTKNEVVESENRTLKAPFQSCCRWGTGETQRSGTVSLHFVFLAKGNASATTELFRINRFSFGGQGIAVKPKIRTSNFTLTYTSNANASISSVGVFTDPLTLFPNSSAAVPTSIGVANATAGANTPLVNSTVNGTAGNVSVAINCGSNRSLALSDGSVYEPDAFFVGGQTLTNLLTFTGTTDQVSRAEQADMNSCEGEADQFERRRMCPWRGKHRRCETY